MATLGLSYAHYSYGFVGQGNIDFGPLARNRKSKGEVEILQNEKKGAKDGANLKWAFRPFSHVSSILVYCSSQAKPRKVRR